jgi:hypothetical protein
MVTDARTVAFVLLAFCFVVTHSAGVEAATDAGGRSDYNLLRNTRLVAGLPSGWAVTGRNNNPFSEGEDVVYGTDAAMIGPSGYPALKVEMLKSGMPSTYGWQDSVILYTEPFKVHREGIYTASAYLQGSGEGALEIVSDHVPGQWELQKVVASRSFAVSVGQDWTRVACAFSASPGEKLYGMRFKLKGKLWFDGFQVNPGKEALTYQSELPAEVALAPVGGDLEDIRIQFSDESAKARWVVTDAQSGAVLKARVINLYGDVRDLPAIPLKGEKLETGEWSYDVFGVIKLGQFRVEAWVEGADGSLHSARNELVFTRLRRPHYWGRQAPGSPFGIHIQPTRQQIQMAKAFGLNWVRLHDTGIQLIGWSFLEYAPDQWHFFDAELDRYRNGNLCILAELGTAPPWRSRAKMSSSPPLSQHDSSTATYFEPLDLKEFGDYTRRVVERYQEKIQSFEIWNEPWCPPYFYINLVRERPVSMERAEEFGTNRWYINSATAPEDFVRLQKTAFDTIKRINPSLNVVGLGTHGIPLTAKDGTYRGEVWTKRTAAAGGMDSLDVVGYHVYTDGPLGFRGDSITEQDTEALGALGGITNVRQKGYRVWMTEGSPVASKTRSGFYNYTLPYQDTEEYRLSADRVARYVIRLLSEGIDKVFLYSIDAATYFGEEGRFRLLVTEDGFPHPTGVAMSTVAWNLEDTKYRESVETSNQKATAYVFDGRERSVAALLPRPGILMPVPKPNDSDIQVEDIFGNPPKGTVTNSTLFFRGSRKEIDRLVAEWQATPWTSSAEANLEVQ